MMRAKCLFTFTKQVTENDALPECIRYVLFTNFLTLIKVATFGTSIHFFQFFQDIVYRTSILERLGKHDIQSFKSIYGRKNTCRTKNTFKKRLIIVRYVDKVVTPMHFFSSSKSLNKVYIAVAAIKANVLIIVNDTLDLYFAFISKTWLIL